MNIPAKLSVLGAINSLPNSGQLFGYVVQGIQRQSCRVFQCDFENKSKMSIKCILMLKQLLDPSKKGGRDVGDYKKMKENNILVNKKINSAVTGQYIRTMKHLIHEENIL